MVLLDLMGQLFSIAILQYMLGDEKLMKKRRKKEIFQLLVIIKNQVKNAESYNNLNLSLDLPVKKLFLNTETPLFC